MLRKQVCRARDFETSTSVCYFIVIISASLDRLSNHRLSNTSRLNTDCLLNLNNLCNDNNSTKRRIISKTRRKKEWQDLLWVFSFVWFAFSRRVSLSLRSLRVISHTHSLSYSLPEPQVIFLSQINSLAFLKEFTRLHTKLIHSKISSQETCITTNVLHLQLFRRHSWVTLKMASSLSRSMTFLVIIRDEVLDKNPYQMLTFNRKAITHPKISKKIHSFGINSCIIFQ